jgi:hypothetical protein
LSSTEFVLTAGGAHLLHLLLHVCQLSLQLCFHVSGYSLRVLTGSSDSFSLSATQHGHPVTQHIMPTANASSAEYRCQYY